MAKFRVMQYVQFIDTYIVEADDRVAAIDAVRFDDDPGCREDRTFNDLDVNAGMILGEERAPTYPTFTDDEIERLQELGCLDDNDRVQSIRSVVEVFECSRCHCDVEKLTDGRCEECAGAVKESEG